MTFETAVGLAIVVLLLLMTQSWFWALLAVVGGAAAFFSMVASVIHFQILAAMGYLLLLGICVGIYSAATE